MAGRDLLIEIGIEELPASFIQPALDFLPQRFRNELDNRGIAHGDLTAYGTPRRLALLIESVEAKGPDRTELVTGPPRRVAFDGSGQPTKAALGFARAQGVEPGDLIVVETEKGEYLAANKSLAGESTVQMLQDWLWPILGSIPFPKSMRWGRGEFVFPRPIHWLVVLFGDEVVEVELAGIRSGRVTFGHRFMSPQPIELKSPAEYAGTLARAKVVVDPAQRREITLKAAREAAAAKGGRLLEDQDLVDLNANLVEFPSAVCGRFDQAFLELPQEVVITAMKEHQKYFAVVDGSGRLMPLFVAVNNTLARDPEVVRRGHERVLRARLADAAFFFDEDAKESFQGRIEELKRIVYHRQLGTSYEKVARFAALTGWLAERLAPEDREKAVRAAWLSKCDLTSLMVGEFPGLQGLVGRAYALREGLDGAVAQAIGEHYLPVSGSPTAELPGTAPGALVSLADKMDTIAGMFAINKPPTGAADPFALRRAALGAIRILIERGWSPGLSEFIKTALQPFHPQIMERGNKAIGQDFEKAELTRMMVDDEVPRAITDFFRARLLNLFTGQGFDHDAVEAVLELYLDDPAAAAPRIKALQGFKRSPSFAEGAIAFKRLFNILKGQSPAGQVREDLFQQAEETELLSAARALSQEVRELARAGRFEEVLARLSGLKPMVDRFFDQVLVMAEEADLRANRLALVAEVAGLFGLVADFSRLQTG